MPPKHQAAGPAFVRYFAPVLQALRDLGGSARPAEVRDRVAALISLSDAAAAETIPSGQLRFDNQVHWARFYLSRAGFIDSSTRGVWTLTEKGTGARLSQSEALAIFKQTHQFVKSAAPEAAGDAGGDEASEVERAPTEALVDHRAAAHALLMRLSPAGFERFAQRLLREAGFQDVSVTGRSGDGGIDGIGILQVNPLVSFKVLFQCKRYVSSVTPSQVRDFRGAMQGRADKGIIVTTGTFTAEAKKEAIRDGVPPIELMDGERLVDMLEQLELGLKPTKAFVVDEAFFAGFGFDTR
ncbi:MAG TPA: restriction endonuclease [Gemmatimonadaceae bacterium]|nr:restriction endonuclease [Gemmatimonadaceae bacterium]